MVTKSKQYKLYLFDLDGTLLDSDEMLRVTFHQLYKLYKPVDYVIDDSHILTFSGPQISETLLNEFPDKDQELMLSEWKKYSAVNYVKHATLYPGAENLMRMFKEKNIKFAVVTNKHRYATKYAYELLKIDDLDIFSICADDVENLKPEPDGIYKAMEHFGVTSKEDVVYIGDSIYDYLTAKNAGVDFGYVSWSPRKLPNDSKIDLLIDKYATFAEEFRWKRPILLLLDLAWLV